MSCRDASIEEADAEVLRLISAKVDSLLMLSETDAELRNYALKFKLEQAVDQTAFQAKREEGEEMLHLQRVLRRMADLALHVAPHILRRTRRHRSSRCPVGNDDAAAAAAGSTPAEGTASDSIPRNSSVEDVCDGSEAWLETGAHLSHSSVELLCLILVCHPRLVKALQMYLLECDVLAYVADALSIPCEHEIAFFQEGYRTEHVRLMANLTLDNREACSAIVGTPALLSAILTSTRVDEENPGMVEWAEFCIRNLCCCTSEAREKIRRMLPVSISGESRELLAGRADCQLTQEGKLVLTQPCTTKTK
ncbi:uncharacterized protein Tco025E_00576 [Trypanosoma conorhini]|uniref:Ataxin-10 domain-containing protein n=1 Tax=Trypanosoma conorhini TaxID=83891 RepID=A0A3R7M5Z0_9TRYP|nr:uncharacterized protein Tco025E_00576 [Trypanosoma conorhini]RNF27202.1 hypothetical protein Tco025E_00576 [Trypanosoma conorhini]